MDNFVADLISGKLNAFERFFNNHSDSIFTYALRHCKDEMVAKDVVQDVFIRFWNNRHNLDPNQNIGAYLYTITKHVVFEELRKKSLFYKYEKYALSKGEVGSSYSEENFNYRELEMVYQDAIKILPNKRKKIYQLSKLGNMSNSEISKELNISTNTVRDQLVKANKTIRSYIKRKFAYFF